MGQNKSKMVLTAALAFLFVIAFAASVASADDPPCTCGDICVNTTGWWRDGGTFKASSTPIQHAIDNATAGDTICVMDGTYNENVDVTKSDLTIRSENGPLVTTVSASLYPNKHVFKITDQTDVTLKGFEIRDAHGTTKDVAGIYMDNANECNISDNRVTNISATGDYNGADGIWLRSSSNNSFVTTTVYNLSSADSSARGIDLRSSSGNSFHTTSVYNLSAYRAYGIWLDSSSGNSFDTTTVYNLDADNDTRGIMLDFSSDNSFHTTTVYNLSADKYAFGILLDSSSYNSFDPTTVYNLSSNGDAYGIFLYSSSYNSFDPTTVYNLSAYECANGIFLYSSSDNNSFDTSTTVYNLDAYDYDVYGIRLVSSSYNSFGTTTVYNISCVDCEPYGIILDSSSYNSFDTTTVYNLSSLYMSASGIILDSSSDNNSFDTTTVYNLLAPVSAWGIYLRSSSNNRFSSSTTVYNLSGHFHNYGIYLDSSSDNSFVTSTVYNLSVGDAYGIYLDSSSDNSFSSSTVYNLSAYDDAYGIWLDSSSDNSFSSGSISDVNAPTWWDFYSSEDAHGNSAREITISSFPTTISFTYDNGIKLKSVATPPADPAGKRNISKYVNVTNVTADSWLFMNVSYEEGDLGGVDENSLRLWRHNGTDWTEVPGTNGVNTAENYVYANITEFSVFAPLGTVTGVKLEINKTGVPDPVSPGGTLNYTISVNNTGNATATNVTVKETYDGNVTFVVAVPAPSQGNDTWQFPMLNVSETKWVNISVLVNESAPNGTVLHNIVNVTCDEGVTDFDTEDTTVLSAVAPVLEINKTGVPDPVSPGGTLNYSISVNNTGNATATNVTVKETYDGNVTFVMAVPAPSPGNDTWKFATLNVSETRWINISVTVNASVLNGTVLHNIVNVTCDEGVMDSDIENTTVLVAPVLNCTCGDICVNETGWWRDGGAFNASNTPIQHAIDNATAGDTICVKDGTYTENVDVKKRLTIKSENGSANCIVNASDSSDHVFDVQCDYVNITGFTVENATENNKAGIYLSGREHCNISDNIVTNNEYGIYLYLDSNNNYLINNTASGNKGDGFKLESNSNHNRIIGNNASDNDKNGIRLYGTTGNPSSHNTVANNTADLNDKSGIMIEGADSDHNTIVNNTCKLNDYGISIRYGDYNNLTNNICNQNSEYGIRLYQSADNNELTNNTAISNTEYGIYISSSDYNLIYNNYFNNTNNANDNGNNVWNTTKTLGTNIIGGPYLGGNYWSDYAGRDINGDGLGDTLLPYNSSGGITNDGDYHPLVPVGYAPVLSIEKSDDPDPVSPGGTLNYTISVNNTGNATATNVTVIEAYDGNVTFVSAVPAPSPGNDTWEFATLNASETRWINISVTVNASVLNGTVLHNIVNVTCDEGVTDSDTENTTVFVAPALPPNIISFAPPSPVNDTVCNWRTFNVTVNQTVNVSWYLNNTLQHTNVSTKEAKYSLHAEVVGEHNVSAIASNGNGTDMQSWVWNVTVAPLPVLEINKTCVPNPVSPAGALNYTIRVNNAGNATATNVTVKETYDANVTFVAAEPAPSSGDDTWQFPTLNVSETRWINVSVNVNASVLNGTELHNIVNVTCDEGVIDSDTENTTVFVAPVPVLEINKTDAPDPVLAGGTLNYSISVNNTGNATASNVTVIETYDKNVTFVAAVPVPSPGDDTWQFPTLNASETRWINISVTVNVSVPNGTVLHNIVTVSCDEGVTDSDTEDTTVFAVPVCVETATDTGIACFATDSGTIEDLVAVDESTLPEEGKPELVFPHGFFSFNITGLTQGRTVVVTITLPDNVPVGTQYWKYHAAEGGWIRIQMGSDDGDNVITITLVDGGLGDDDGIANGVIVDQGGPGIPGAPPGITSFAPPSPVNDTVCNWRTFNVTVDQTVNVSWYLNNTLQHTNVSTKEANYSLHAEVVGEHNVSAIASNANGTDMQSWVWNVTAAPEPVLEINKTDNPDPVSPGGTLNYTIRVNNTGNATAINVIVKETYDANVTFIAAEPAPSSGDDTWQFPTLNVSETRWINVSVNVNASVPNGTVLHNIVNVTCDEGVTDSDTEDTTVFVAPALPPNITSFAPPSPVNDTVCNWRTFNVTVNQTVNVSWYLNNTLQHTNVSTKEAKYSLHAEVVGEHNVSAIASNANGTDMQSWVWNVSAAPALPPNIISFAPPSPVSDTVCTWRTFNITVNQTVNVSWYLNNTIQHTNVSTKEASYTIHAEVVGDHNVSAIASNANGTDMQTWVWNVTAAPALPPNIISFAPPSPVNDTVCNWRTFNVTVNQTVNVSWYLNNTLQHTNVSTKEAKYSLHAEVVGEHNVSAIASNANGTDMQTWVWNVTAAPALPPNIISFAPPSPVSDTVCNWRTFNITVNQTVNVSWYLNNTLQHTNVSTKEASYTIHAEVVGEHNVSAIASNANGTDMQTWVWNVTAAPVPVLEINKTSVPDPVSPGGTLNYTIHVNNTGNATATNVMVMETYDGNVTFVAAVPAPSSGDDTWQFPTLNVSEMRWINISVIVNVSVLNGTVLHNIVNVTCDEGVTDSDTEDTTVLSAAAPVLEITKTDAPDPVSPGSTLNYSIRVNNTGNATATNVTVMERYDKNVTFVTAVPAPSQGNDTWKFATLNASETRWINISVTVNASVLNGTVLHNIVNVTCDEGVTDSDTESTTVFVEPVPVLEITKADAPDPVSPGGRLNYTISVNNTGNATATNVTVMETYDENVTFVVAVPAPSSGDDMWQFPTLNVSETRWINISVIVNASVLNGTVLHNIVNVSCDEGVSDSDTENTTVFVAPVPVLEITKADAPDPVAPGGTITYTILYANVGPVALTDVTITENYPEGVTFISADPAPDAGTNNMWTIGTLPAGSSGQIIIKVKVPESRDLTFTETGSVTGEGFVMVSKDLSTEQKPYRLKNVVTISCAETDPVSASASTTVSGVPGTSLEITEHGSGIYESEEILNLETKNKSIRLQKSTKAEYQPTSFYFSDSFSVDFTTRWMQDICSKNMVMGDAMHKKIKHATYIKDETKTETGEYGTSMEFASSFHGAAHIGAVSKDVTTSEDYIGEFEIFWAAKEECQYLFNWSRVPGNDSEKLIRFLVDNLAINWAENATITKSDDDRIINISTDWHSAEVILAANNETATVKVGNEAVYVLDVRTEDGSLNLNVYDCRLRKISESVAGEGYVMVDKELTSGHIQVVEHGSGIYSSDMDFNSQRLNKSTEAEYQPTTFNFSDGFGVNFSSNWMQDICAKDKKAGTAIHKKISNAVTMKDDTTATKSSMAFETSFNGSMHIGARTEEVAISEDYIGQFNVSQVIKIGDARSTSTSNTSNTSNSSDSPSCP